MIYLLPLSAFLLRSGKAPLFALNIKHTFQALVLLNHGLTVREQLNKTQKNEGNS